MYGQQQNCTVPSKLQILCSLMGMQTEMPMGTRNIVGGKEQKERHAVMRKNYNRNATINSY